MASSNPAGIPLDVALNWRLVAFTFGVSLLTGVAFGLMPALRLSRHDLADSIKSGGRVVGSRERLGSLPLGKVLVVAQVALSLTLLVGALLFLRTVQNLLRVDTGFDRERVVTARFDPRLAQVSEEQMPALYDRLLAEARRIPGVQGASLALTGPATGSWRVSSFIVEGQARRAPGEDTAREEYVEPGYFGVLGMPILRGRDFSSEDGVKGSRRDCRQRVDGEEVLRHRRSDRQAAGVRRAGDDDGDRDRPRCPNRWAARSDAGHDLSLAAAARRRVCAQSLRARRWGRRRHEGRAGAGGGGRGPRRWPCGNP